MLEFMKLELRKQRRIILALLGTLLFTCLVFGPFLISTGGESWLTGAGVTTLAWAIGGVPLLTVVFGASAGAGLRTEPTASAEAPLPLSPGRKLSGAFAAAAAGWTAITATVAVLALAFASRMPARVLDRPGAGWTAGLPIAAGLALLLLLNSFAFSYAFRQGLLGGLLGLALGLLTAGGIGFGVVVRAAMHDEFRSADWKGAVAAGFVAFVGPLFALSRLARWGERRVRPGFAGWLLIGAGLGAGALGAAGWLARGYSSLARQFLFEASRDPDEAPGVTLVNTLDGGLLAVNADGLRTELLAPLHRNPLQVLRFGRQIRVIGHEWDRNGSLWVLAHSPEALAVETQETHGLPDFELWHGDGKGPLRLEHFFKAPPGLHPYDLLRRGDTLGMLAWPDEKGAAYRFAPLPAPGHAPDFQPVPRSAGGADDDPRVEFLLEAGGWAEISQDGTTLSRSAANGERQVWRLPPGAMAQIPGRVAPLPGGAGAPWFPLRVKLADGEVATAICGPDGAVSLAWRAPQGGERVHLIRPDGDRWAAFPRSFSASGKGAALLVMSGDGRAQPALAVDAARLAGWLGHPSVQEVWPVKMELLGMRGGHIWMLYPAAGQLLEVDAEGGGLISRHALPGSAPLAPAGRRASWEGIDGLSKAGFFLLAQERLYHFAWDGKFADLGPAFW